jgi:hypothetical protein
MGRAMRTELTGPMDSEMIEEIAHASKRFQGRPVRVTIEEVTEEPVVKKSRVKPPNTHSSKTAPSLMATSETEGLN